MKGKREVGLLILSSEGLRTAVSQLLRNFRGGASRKFKPNPRSRAPREYAVVAEKQSVHGSLKESMEPAIGIRWP